MIEGKLLVGKHIANITWYILPFSSFACPSTETQNNNTQAFGFRTLGATVKLRHTSIFSCCSSVFIGTYEKIKQFGSKLAFPMTWQSYIV